MKVDKNIYEKLKKIKRPILLEVKCLNPNNIILASVGSRYRILCPNGKCEWTLIDSCCWFYLYSLFSESCFEQSKGISTTVDEMQAFDKKSYDSITYKIIKAEYI